MGEGASTLSPRDATHTFVCCDFLGLSPVCFKTESFLTCTEKSNVRGVQFD